MLHLLVALAALLHVLWWGAGLAALGMPRPWTRFWPVLVLPAGLALQSAVVWFGSYANLPGTNSYALASEVIPAVLLALAWWRSGRTSLALGVRNFRWLHLGTALALLLAVLPLALASRGLTSISLGSCDAADYAAGARTLMEFAHGDRSGFLGLAEVVHIQSVDNFFDFWLRLNHFTPSALIAFNGSVLHCAPHELTSIMTMLIAAATLPLMWWMARAVVGLDARASGFAAALYVFSPVVLYAVAQVAPGQLLAAQAIALITWAGTALWRVSARGWRGVARFATALAIGYWLILGSYNFVVIVCLVPAVAYAGGLALRRGAWTQLVRWGAAMLAPLVLCGVLFYTRVAGLIERFTLFRTYDFGWRIAPLTPDGWLGFVRDTNLTPLGWVARALISLVVLVLVALAFRARSRAAWRAVALTVPPLIGYAFLEIRGAALGTNASYDAYKLLAVFFPGVLAVSVGWLRWLGTRRHALAIAAAVVVGIAHAQVYSHFYRALKTPPLLVPIELRDVRRVETMDDVASVNMLLPDMWSRLWANAFLLRKPQYFLTHTYEGRLNTPLRGEWDLQAEIVRVQPENEAAFRAITPRYSLVDTRDPAFVRPVLAAPELGADGWHPTEQIHAGGERWRWTSGDARIRITNPHAYPVTLHAQLDASSLEPRDLALVREGAAPREFVALPAKRATVALPAVEVPPGESTLILHSRQPPTRSPGDPRPLGVCVFHLTFEPRR